MIKKYVSNLSKILNEPLPKDMQKSIRIWEELMIFIGGKPELIKCKFFIINWGFDKDDKHFIKENKQSISFLETNDTYI